MGPNLAKNIPYQSDNPNSYIKPGNLNTIYVQPINCEEMCNIVTTLKNASVGYAGIAAKVVKKSVENFFNPLTHICNLSLKQGIVPDEMKTAKYCHYIKEVNNFVYQIIDQCPSFQYFQI